MKARTAKAVLWMMVDVGGGQGLSFVIYLVLARILTPRDYGVFSLALAIITVLSVVVQNGCADAVVQREHVGEDHLSTAFWTNLALALTIFAGLQLATPGLVVAFGTPALGPVLRVMSLICVFRALVSVHTALCRRELRMSVFAARAIGGYLVGGGAGILLALAGWGVWALVVCQVGQALVILVVMWATIPWRPRFVFSASAFRNLARFGQHILAAATLLSLADRIGMLVIGLFLDVTSLGYFALAYKIFQTITLITLTPFEIVLLPILSPMGKDPGRFGATYAEIVTAANAVWMPAAAGLGVLAPVLLPLAFGSHWTGTVPVIQAMSWAAATAGLWTFTGQALAALGRPDAFAVLAAVQLAVAALAYAIASQFGVVMVGWAWAGVSAVMVPVHLAVLHRISRVDLKPLLSNATRLALCTAAMAAAVMAELHAVGHFSALWASAAAVAVGATLYVALLELVLMPGYFSRLLASLGLAVPRPGIQQ